MTPILPNPFNPQQLASSLSCAIIDCDRYVSPSGQVVDILTVRETCEDASGKCTTNILKKVEPPLADGVTPESKKEIRECNRCLSLIHVTSSHVCPGCNFTFCRVCAPEVERAEKCIRLCVECAEKSDPSLLKVPNKLIWGK